MPLAFISDYARYIQLSTDTRVLDTGWATPVIHPGL
jgi:hypothetical protein